jgi:hypothetical protein
MSQDPNTSNVEPKSGYGVEEIQVVGEQLLARVRELVHEGNVRRIIIRRQDKTLLEIPLTFGVVGTAASLAIAPIVVAVGALGALLANVTVQVVRTEGPSDVYTPPTHGYTGTTGSKPGEPPTGPTF